MKARSQDVLDLLRTADPVDVFTVPDPESLEGRRILNRVLTPAQGLPGPARATRRRPTKPSRSLRPVRLALAASVAAAILVPVLILGGLPLSGRPESTASAAEVLHRLSNVAAAQSAEAGTTGGYRYQKSDQANTATTIARDGSSFTVLEPSVREIWVGPDGSGRIRTTYGEPVFPGPRDQEEWERAGRPELVKKDVVAVEDFGPGGLFFADFVSLPVEPAALEQALRAMEPDPAVKPGDPAAEARLFGRIGDFLREPGAPPELRAALYRVAAGIQGVELVGEVTDRAGRSGVAVAMTSKDSGSSMRHLLIFDPETAALLGEERVLLDRATWLDAEPGTVIGYATYFESGVVGRIDPPLKPGE